MSSDTHSGTTWLHAMPIVPVSDMDRSMAYYDEVLGLQLAWRHEAGNLVAMAAGGIEVVLLARWTGDDRPPQLSAYVYVEDPDTFCAQCSQAGGEIVEPVGSRSSGMRDFVVRDPDGHLFRFGRGEERLRDVAWQYGLTAGEIAVEPKWLERRKQSRSEDSRPPG